MSNNGFSLYGNDLFGHDIEPPKRGKIADEFYHPPFSVLNSREGFWQERKAAWISKGIVGECGRDENLINHSKTTTLGNKDTSIFDPVLCELCYRWFCPPGGSILDPFAGGSVRGIVASCLGLQYDGLELRPEQVAANREQAESICDFGPLPHWFEVDSAESLPQLQSAQKDFVFSCPPYGNLEVYSDDPRDLSTMVYPAFREKYRAIIAESVRVLKPDRFAAFVVGNFRGPDGAYCDLVGDTVRAFEDGGARFYNEAILVTAVGSLSIRIRKQFETSRKMGKTHQNLLVFIKGNPRNATATMGADDGYTNQPGYSRGPAHLPAIRPDGGG